MIISASRRTDLPAFHSDWFMERLRVGSCDVPNPMNPKQVSSVSLRPEDVEAIVFWTRNPEPLVPHLAELDSLGYQYIFLYTLMDNPEILDPGMGELQERIATFIRLSDRLGPKRVIWRYDPIIISNLSPPAFHVRTFEKLARELEGSTQRCIVSLLDLYRKIRKRLDGLIEKGCEVRDFTEVDLEEMLPELAGLAEEYGMTIQSCAEATNLSPYGIPPGACIDATYLSLKARGKDSAQRPACLCAKSRDIGKYGTCEAGCVYCYAS